MSTYARQHLIYGIDVTNIELSEGLEDELYDNYKSAVLGSMYYVTGMDDDTHFGRLLGIATRDADCNAFFETMQLPKLNSYEEHKVESEIRRILELKKNVSAQYLLVTTWN